MVSLDERRNAIADMFLTEVIVGPEGNLVNKTIKVIEGVSQTFGVPYEKFLEYGRSGARTRPAIDRGARRREEAGRMRRDEARGGVRPASRLALRG